MLGKVWLNGKIIYKGFSLILSIYTIYILAYKWFFFLNFEVDCSELKKKKKAYTSWFYNDDTHRYKA